MQMDMDIIINAITKGCISAAIFISGWKSEILVDISGFFLYIFHETLVISY
jgi:hypothetical protein